VYIADRLKSFEEDQNSIEDNARTKTNQTGRYWVPEAVVKPKLAADATSSCRLVFAPMAGASLGRARKFRIGRDERVVILKQ